MDDYAIHDIEQKVSDLQRQIWDLAQRVDREIENLRNLINEGRYK